MTNIIEVRGGAVGGGRQPLVCAPLVGKTREVILSEVATVIRKRPDLIEWRVDFFEGIGDVNEVVDVAKRIKVAGGNTPVIFTRRSAKEGGEPVSLSEEDVVALYAAVCDSRSIEIIDYEMSNLLEHVRHLRGASRETETKMIISYHNFRCTPGVDVLNERFLEAEHLGADIAKVAVMPNTLEDVLTLLTATLQSSQRLKIPLMSMSMGAYGSLTRLFGWVFGSAITFAVGESRSAPGQVPIEDLRTVLEITQKFLGPG